MTGRAGDVTIRPAHNRPFTRRGFLRASAAVLGGAPALLACDGPSGGDDAPPTNGAAHQRPLLTEWADGMIRISAPLDELPVAYVSMDLRAVFVDSEYRDRASWLLRAHISVSTWHWRIPLPGDDPGVPISPGDERREFEEHPIRAWDPAMTPAMDDIRIRRGVPTPVTLHADCVPLAGVHTVERPSARPPEAPIEAWIRGGPWDVTTGVGRTDTVREDFGVLGTAQRHPTRACAGAGELVQVVGWSVRSAG